MSRSHRLKIVETLAKQREDQAAQALAQVRDQLLTEQERLSELVQYRQDYLDYLDQQGAKGISMQQWRRTQGFIDQLTELSNRQQSTIVSWKARETQLLEKWRALYQKRRNIGKYIGQLSLEELITRDKQEQKQIDEMVNQRYSV